MVNDQDNEVDIYNVSNDTGKQYIRMNKRYISEKPVTDIIEKFKEKYENTRLAAVKVRNAEGKSEITNTQLSADDEGNIYPANLRMVLENKTVLDIAQYKKLDPRAKYGKEPEGDSYDEPYLVEIQLMDTSKEKIEDVFNDFYQTYSEILEDFSESKSIAEDVKCDPEYGSKHQISGSKKSESDTKQLAQKYKVDLSGYSKDSIVLPEDVLNKVENTIEGPLKNPDLYENIPTNRKGIILEGEPGVGKTLLAKVLSSEADANMYAVTVSDIMTKWVGESAKNVDKLFNMAKEYAPSIIFMDEADSLLMRRTGQSSHNEDENMVNTLLKNMDGMEENKGVKVIAATNKIEKVDEAFLRYGRFGEPITLEKPNEEAREKIYELHTIIKNSQLFEEEIRDYLSDFAEKSEGFTGADIAGTIHIATDKRLNELKEVYGDIKDIPPEEMKLDHNYIYKAINEKDVEEETPLGFER